MPHRGHRGIDVVMGIAGLAVIAGTLVAIPSLSITTEDRVWEGMWREVGVRGAFCTPQGSFRPMCGLLLLAEDGLPHAVKLLLGYALHLAVVALVGALAARLAGRRAALPALVMPLVWSTQPEVTLWLGGRCELTWVLPGLLGAHAFLTALRRDDARWSALAAALVGIAALGKEPGFLLPLVYWPLGWGHARAKVRDHLAWTSVLVPPVLAYRTVVAQGVGSYVAPLLARGPVDWAGNLAHALTKLTLGAVIDWPNPVAIAVPLVGAAIAVWLLRGADRRAGVRFVLGLSVLLAPTALVHDARTLYGAVAYAAVAVGVATVTRPRLAPWLALALALHAGAAMVSQRLWVEVAEARTAAIREIARAADQEGMPRVYVIGPRSRPMGIIAGEIHEVDFPRNEVHPLVPRPYSENVLAWFTRDVAVERVDACAVRIEMDIPQGELRSPRGVALTRESPTSIVARFDGPALLVYTERDAAVLRRVRIACER